MQNEIKNYINAANDRSELFAIAATLTKSSTASEEFDSAIVVGSNSVELVSRIVSYSGGNVTLSLIEDSDLTVGAEYSSICLNRTKVTVPTFTVNSATDVTDGSTLAAPTRLLLGTSTGQPHPVEYLSVPVTLKANTTYHLKIVAGASSMSIVSEVLIIDKNAAVASE